MRPEDWEPFKDLDPEIPNPDYPNLNIERVKKQTREYLAAVKSIDRNVGRVLELLNELELEDNFIIVFTSDHGYNLGRRHQLQRQCHSHPQGKPREQMAQHSSRATPQSLGHLASSTNCDQVADVVKPSFVLRKHLQI